MKLLNILLLILLLGFSNLHAQSSLELKIKGVKDLGLESCNSVEIKFSVKNTGEEIFHIKIPDHLNYPDELISLLIKRN